MFHEDDVTETICGAKCKVCGLKSSCKGCIATDGCPFGEKCSTAEYITEKGKEGYLEYKQTLLNEINAFLTTNGIPTSEALYELAGKMVNLSFTLPNGNTVKFLNDNKIYLGCQVEDPDGERYYGIVSDGTFIMISTYTENGNNPELVMFKRRELNSLHQ